MAIEGEVAWYESTPGAIRRGFCPVCGSNLFWERDRRRASSRSGPARSTAPTGLRLAGHIFVADKGDYYEIADGLPQAAERDPAAARTA